jgi:PKD repeat protein
MSCRALLGLGWFLAFFLPCFSAGAVGQQGVDCECNSVGNYVLPAPAVNITTANAATGASPGGKFQVAATGSGTTKSVTVTTAGGTKVLEADGVAWGFSPDDDRFVIYNFSGGLPFAYLHNLVGAAPSIPILMVDVSHDGLIAFSPHGIYAAALSFNPASPSLLDLLVADAATGATRYSTQLALHTPILLPGDLPKGQTQLGAARVGFGPDAYDRTLVYAWVNVISGGQLEWVMVKLDETPALRYGPGGSSYGFDWGFSPCGDRFGMVTANTGTHTKDVVLYSTLDQGAQIPFVTGPITDSHTLSVTTVRHFANFFAGSQQLGFNTAAQSCGGTPPVKPVAAFSVAASRKAGVPFSFSDESTTASGTIVGRTWEFGDGTLSGEANPSKTYATAGTYTVRLTAFNSVGQSDTEQKSIAVAPNDLPVPSFTFTPASPERRDSVKFTSTSTDDDTIASTQWTIEGANLFGTEVELMACASSLSVTLLVTDSAGQSATKSDEIAVGGSERVEVPLGENLAQAEQNACAGDTLVLAEGAYPGGATLYDVNVEGAGAGLSVIDGHDADGWVLRFYKAFNYPPVTRTLSKVTVSGGIKKVGPYATTGGGISVEGAAALALSHVEVTHNELRGLYAYSNGAPTLIEDSSFHDNDGGGAVFNVAVGHVARSTFARNLGGVSMDEGGVTIVDSDFHDHQYAAVALGDAGGSIVSSRFWGNGIASGEPAIEVLDGEHLIAGCLVAQNYGPGVFTDGATILDSTIADNCGPGVRADQGTLKNSIIFGNGVEIDGSIGFDAASLVGVEPSFAGAGDYHLSASSPAIDAGDASLLPAELDADGDGDTRVLAGSSGGAALLDVGWDEWREGQPTMSIPALVCPATGGSGGTGGTGAGGSGAKGGMSGTSGGEAGASDGGTGGAADAGRPGVGGASGAAGGHEAPGTAGEVENGNAGKGGSAGHGSSAGGSAGRSVSAGGEGGEAGGRAGDNGHAGSGHPPEPDPGCGCRSVGGSRSPTFPLVVVGLAIGLALKRRRGRLLAAERLERSGRVATIAS